MMQPAHVYYLALILIGIPAATQSRMAAACVAVGLFACLACAMGAPMAWVHVAVYTAGFWAGLLLCERRIVALALFVSLGMMSVAEIAGAVTPHDAWWARWVLVLVQLGLFLPDASQGFLRAFRFVSMQRPDPGGLRFQTT